MDWQLIVQGDFVNRQSSQKTCAARQTTTDSIYVLRCPKYAEFVDVNRCENHSPQLSLNVAQKMRPVLGRMRRINVAGEARCFHGSAVTGAREQSLGSANSTKAFRLLAQQGFGLVCCDAAHMPTCGQLMKNLAAELRASFGVRSRCSRDGERPPHITQTRIPWTHLNI